MLQAIYGKKTKQTQMFDTAGLRIPVTEIHVGPCIVVQIKTQPKDGYWALQLGIDGRANKHMTKPLAGHLKKTGQGNLQPRFLGEVRLASNTTEVPYKIGDQIKIEEIFAEGDKIKVTGVSKSKGFQGGVKRYGFAGGPRTHGQADRERAPGSIGQTTTPGRVYKGKRMAGRTGGETVTVRGLKIAQIDPQTQSIRVKGLIPGRVNMPVLIQKQA